MRKQTKRDFIQSSAQQKTPAASPVVALHHGDCLEILPLLTDASVDLILTDLPYGTTQNHWDSIIPLDRIFLEFKRVIKDNGAIVLFGAMPFSADLIAAGRDMFKYSLVWRKNKSSGFLNAKKMPLRTHEDILVFYKKPPVYNPQKTDGHKPMNAAYRTGHGVSYNPATAATNSEAGTTKRYPTSILEFPVLNNDDPLRVHTTQKPVDLLRWLIRTYTEPGMLVLDATMGSGSTGVAAVSEGRKFVGIEKDKKYFNHARKWIQAAKPSV